MPLPSLLEKLSLAILICLSAAGFWWRFRNVVRIVSSAKPDAGFNPGSLFHRMGNFVREVLLQEKVILSSFDFSSCQGSALHLLKLVLVQTTFF